MNSDLTIEEQIPGSRFDTPIGKGQCISEPVYSTGGPSGGAGWYQWMVLDGTKTSVLIPVILKGSL